MPGYGIWLTMNAGCRPPTRQTRRRVGQLQGSPRGPDEKYSGFTIANRELCLIRLRPISSCHRSPSIRIALVQYPNEITHTFSRLPKLRRPQPRPVIKLLPIKRRLPVRFPDADDGGSTAHKLLHQCQGGSDRGDRTNDQRTRRDLRAISDNGLGAERDASTNRCQH